VTRTGGGPPCGWLADEEVSDTRGRDGSSTRALSDHGTIRQAPPNCSTTMIGLHPGLFARIKRWVAAQAHEASSSTTRDRHDQTVRYVRC